MKKNTNPTQIQDSWRELLRLLRPRQWVKNMFVLAPLLFGGNFLDPTATGKTLLTLALFCLAASAAYIVNDIHDRERDQKHPIKAHTRPLAAGTVSVRAAGMMLTGLYTLLLIGGLLMHHVLAVIVSYVVLNLAYSKFLKYQPVVDIFTIAIGFVLRVYAGAIALSVPMSAWMFVTTLCLALYLAAIKRLQELRQVGDAGRQVLSQYSIPLAERYAEMSATVALVFYSLFVVTAKPPLVITIPLVLFGLFRYWYVVDTLNGGESPTDALLTDLPLLSTVLIWVAVCAWTLWPQNII